MVEALVGQTVVLPCRVNPPPSSTVTVEWRRDGVPLSASRSGETLAVAGVGGRRAPTNRPSSGANRGKGCSGAVQPKVCAKVFFF